MLTVCDLFEQIVICFLDFFFSRGLKGLKLANKLRKNEI